MSLRPALIAGKEDSLQGKHVIVYGIVEEKVGTGKVKSSSDSRCALNIITRYSSFFFSFITCDRDFEDQLFHHVSKQVCYVFIAGQ